MHPFMFLRIEYKTCKILNGLLKETTVIMSPNNNDRRHFHRKKKKIHRIFRTIILSFLIIFKPRRL